ncbi:unnamed protein product [Meganyctiphanes norvegica]|uniref:Uncharacterized protein n=1 Tax=Meganyctiphanes norvegica TaxID=48144 RepID=A0AAV2RWG5_MEGNR
MSSSGGSTDTSHTFEIINAVETKETSDTVGVDQSSLNVLSDTKDIIPETATVDTTTSEDPLVICDQSDLRMDKPVDQFLDLDKPPCELSDLTKTISVSPEDKPTVDENKVGVDDTCIILDDISSSSSDKGGLMPEEPEERRDSMIETLHEYVNKFDNWIEELDQSLGWVPDLEDVPAVKWILDRLP